MIAEGSVYQRKDGRWVAQYQDARGKTRYLYRKTKIRALLYYRTRKPLHLTSPTSFKVSCLSHR
jgi:hypothetical protein